MRYLSNRDVDMQLWLLDDDAVNIPAEGRSRYGRDPKLIKRAISPADMTQHLDLVPAGAV